MRKDVLVYISGPIMAAHGQTEEQNVKSGIEVFRQLLSKQIPAYLPHLTVSANLTEFSYQTWIEYDLAIINHCTHLLMMPRWQFSKGANIEFRYAVERSIPIAYTIEELEEWINQKSVQTVATKIPQ